ncbi:ABC transporter permease [Microbispora sp. GKU 823]|uniref:ABC transporter permease n=1 Tax=Microbispora sp. GKU 823 TaxID=1652100 RepID=UPI00277B4A54|nr:ABC transporter permease [Microbispora sp. GKU 823]
MNRQRLTPARLGPSDVLRTGAAGLRTRPARVVLSALGIAIGIATMIAVLGISSSSREQLLRQLDRLGTNLLTVAPGQTMFGEEAKLPVEALGMVRRIGPVRTASATGTVDTTIRRTDRIPKAVTGGIAVQAATADLLTTLEGRVVKGAWLNAATEARPAVVLGAKAAQRLGITRIGVQVWMGERWFTVVGVLGPMPLAPEIERSALVGSRPPRSTLASTATRRRSTSGPPRSRWRPYVPCCRARSIRRTRRRSRSAGPPTRWRPGRRPRARSPTCYSASVRSRCWSAGSAWPTRW